jgi:hypothetical protein
MQIGNTELDKVYKSVFYPSIEAADLKPVRIDKHNEGGLLKSEIVEHIESASIIIADLTNERPNCYLEIGYAMGLDKFKNLILTAREDHHFDHPNYKKEGPKIHFDLSGYDIIFWSPEHLDQFKATLIQKIKRRLLLIQPKTKNLIPVLWDPVWLKKTREYVEDKIQELGISGYMEVRSSILNKSVNLLQSDLLTKAHDSLIDNFGWPIGVIFLDGDIKPVPKSDGIESDIVTENRHYDYSYYKKNGQFYTALSHFEDSKNDNILIRATRIVRVTEAFMFVARYYTNIGLSFNDSFEITIRHTGLLGRLIKEGFNYQTRIEKRSKEDEVETTLQVTVGDIENNLSDLVAQVIDPLLILFDFDKIGKGVLSSYVDRFVNGNN